MLTPTETLIPPTPTPRPAVVVNYGVPPYYSLYQEPGGPVIASLKLNSSILDLNETQAYEGIIYVLVADDEGRIEFGYHKCTSNIQLLFHQLMRIRQIKPEKGVTNVKI